MSVGAVGAYEEGWEGPIYSGATVRLPSAAAEVLTHLRSIPSSLNKAMEHAVCPHSRLKQMGHLLQPPERRMGGAVWRLYALGRQVGAGVARRQGQVSARCLCCHAMGAEGGRKALLWSRWRVVTCCELDHVNP